MSSKKPSRSRAEVKTAFQNLNIPASLSEKEKELLGQAHDAIRASVADVNVGAAMDAITKASLANQKALAEVTQELAAKVQLLEDLKKNISLESEELVRLHGTKTILEHLDVLKAEHDEQKATLEKEIFETRAKWDEERAQIQKDREREKAEYEYTTGQFRLKDANQWTETVRIRSAAERDRQEQLEKGWKQREDELKLREKELVDLRAAVAGHQAEIEKAVKQAEAIVSNRLIKDHQHAIQLLDRDRNSDRALYEADRKSLTENNVRLEKLVVELRTELAEANKKNAEIATKALESTSSREALVTLQTTLKEAGVNGSIRKS